MRQTRTEEFEAKSEECQLRKHQYTMTFFDCNHLAHVIVIALFYFAFESNLQVQAPGGLYSQGRFNGGFFCVTSLGGFYLQELIFGILRHIQLIALSNVLTTGAMWLPFVLEH